MSKCGWCGKEIDGMHSLIIKEEAIFLIDNDTETELVPGYIEDFCCNGCAWAFIAEIHRLMGLSGKELRNHLIDMHGLSHPPGKPAGVMRDDCLIIDIACNLASIFD